MSFIEFECDACGALCRVAVTLPQGNSIGGYVSSLKHCPNGTPKPYRGQPLFEELQDGIWLLTASVTVSLVAMDTLPKIPSDNPGTHGAETVISSGQKAQRRGTHGSIIGK